MKQNLDGLGISSQDDNFRNSAVQSLGGYCKKRETLISPRTHSEQM